MAHVLLYDSRHSGLRQCLCHLVTKLAHVSDTLKTKVRERKTSMDENQTQPTQAQPAAPTGETETPAASATEQKTESTEQNQSGQTESSEGGSQAVPYDRFKEVNDRAKTYEEQLEQYKKQLEEIQSKQTPQSPPNPQEEIVKQQFKKVADELGYVSRDELQRQKEDEAVRQELSNLESKYSGADGRPKFDRQKIVKFALNKQIGDLEAAYKIMHEQELMNWAISNAANKSKGVPSEKSDGSGAQSGDSNEELMAAYRKGDRNALKKRLMRTKLAQKVVGNS